MNYIELFAGVGGMSMGLERAGFNPVALVEWDRAAAGVIAHRFPDVPLYCDVTKFTGEEVGDARVDLLAFGSPCQDLSVAGKRAGLKDGSRSSLFFHAIRIANRLRLHNGLRFLLWENVVGALSSNQGADFASVLGEMVDLGARDVAYRVLDSQWFGVPQRRRRVFVVADFGGECAAEILSLAEGMSGNPPPSRQAGEGFTHTLSARTKGGGGLGTDTELDGGLIAARMTAFGEYTEDGTASTLKQRDYKDATDLIAHTLRGEGFDASEDGTGRGTPLVCTPILEAGAKTGVSTTDLRAGSGIGKSGDPMFTLQATKQHAVAFSCKDYGTDVGDLAPTLRAMGHAGSHQNGGGQVAVAFAQNQAGELRTSDVMGTLGTNSNASGRATPMVQAPQSGVRRLTPTECERLQGWPDSHTRFRRDLVLDGNRWHIKPDSPIREQADGPRYKQCGNGVTSSVAFWIASRLVKFSK
jgi:DNA (cytosine-5)-methyltransferase 1